MNELNRTTYELRPHQEEAIEAISKSFKKGKKRPVLQAPCSFGKTLISIDIIKQTLKRLQAKGDTRKIVFCVDRVTLIEQTSREFDKHGLTDHGIIQADHPRTDYAKQVQIASIQTLAKWIYKPEFALIIQDENHAQYKTFTEFLDSIPKTPVIGLSGTPWAKGMAKHWDDLIVTKTAKQLMSEGYISDYVVYGGEVPDTKDIKIQAGDYNQKQLAEASSNSRIIGDIVKNWLRYGENRQTVLFCVNIAHSKKICKEFEQAGIRTGHIDAFSKPKERDHLLKLHDSGVIKILSNCTVFSKGHDSPSTTCLILARKTKSLMLYVQMLFRVLRVSPDGKEAIILDHSGSCSELGRPEDIIKHELCNGEKVDKKEKKIEELERELKSEKPCVDCGFLHSKFKCPSCGREPPIDPRVEEIKAELKLIYESKNKKLTAAQKRAKSDSQDEKARMLSAFRNVVLGDKKQYGHMHPLGINCLFKSYYGHDVSTRNKHREPTIEDLAKAQSFRKHRQIAWANRKKQK